MESDPDLQKVSPTSARLPRVRAPTPDLPDRGRIAIRAAFYPGPYYNDFFLYKDENLTSLTSHFKQGAELRLFWVNTFAN